MPESNPGLRRGRIIWASVEDHRGARKIRPAIILTATAQIRDDEAIEVMAVSTSYAEPPPPDHVELPWHNDPRRVRTRLRQRSAAVVTWLRALHPDDIVDFAGDVPPGIMIEIIKRLEELDRTE